MQVLAALLPLSASRRLVQNSESEKVCRHAWTMPIFDPEPVSGTCAWDFCQRKILRNSCARLFLKGTSASMRTRTPHLVGSSFYKRSRRSLRRSLCIQCRTFIFLARFLLDSLCWVPNDVRVKFKLMQASIALSLENTLSATL